MSFLGQIDYMYNNSDVGELFVFYVQYMLSWWNVVFIDPFTLKAIYQFKSVMHAYPGVGGSTYLDSLQS